MGELALPAGRRSQMAQHVPVQPNAAILTGTLLSDSPDRNGRLWKVQVESVTDCQNYPNFLTSTVTSVIELFIHEEVARKLGAVTRFTARVAYLGDERG